MAASATSRNASEADNSMAKVQIKYEKIPSFAHFFSMRTIFNAFHQRQHDSLPPPFLSIQRAIVARIEDFSSYRNNRH